MKKNSYQKLSFLGLVLTAASGVAAAIIPSKQNTDGIGKIVASTGGLGNQQTCIFTVHPVACTLTDETATTGGMGTSADRFSSSGKHTSNSPE